MKPLVAVFLILSFNASLAQVSGRFRNDPHLPSKGRLNGALLTTYSSANPPPILIGDLMYGVSDRFAVGLSGGTTGTLALYGIRVNASVFQREYFRVLFRFTSIYYPERNGPFLFDRDDEYVMPWMLSMAVTDAEFRTKKGLRWSLGIGLLETHCINDMKMWFGMPHDHSHHAEDGHVGEMDSGELIDVFNTLHGSFSIPLSRRFTLRTEVIAVFKGTELIEKGQWKVGFPINPYISVAYAF
jgi:hypothetical protein